MSDEENPLEMRMDEVLAEYLSQCDAGSVSNRDAFLEKHPELREQLTELLDAADWIEHLAGPPIGDVAEPDLENQPASSDSNKPGGSLLDDTASIANAPGEKSSVPNGRSDDVSSNRRSADTDPGDTLPHLGSIQAALNSDTLGANVKKKDATRVETSTSLPRAEATQPMLPCQFGEYVLERVLGRGGMGVVYFGKQSALDRPVAVKMIRSGALASEEEVERFYAEARSAAQLRHPNIVTVYQCGELDGHRYFSMDFVPGTDLARMIADGPLDVRTAATYVRDVARAIQYAHDRGILHRDLKPANILVDEHGTVRITDFGLAKSIGTDSGLTAEGAALGTPSYMSPEQAAGRTDEQHHATDVYSLGAILFTLVTGKPPFKAKSVVETIMHVIHRPAPTARSVNPNVHADIETIVDVCLQKSPERRYKSAGDLAADLDRFLQGTPIQARPLSRFRRAWYWLLGVPIFGAVLDHRVVEPTDAHRWFQRGLISAALLMVASWMATILPGHFYRNRMPSRVRVASGMARGSYDEIAHSICASLEETNGLTALTVPTEGSRDNVERLESREVDLALLQADAIGSPSVAVVAPLYYEAVHVFVRKGSGINSLRQLRDRRINVGGEKAGSRSVAELVLQRAGLTLDDVQPVSFDWHSMKSSEWNELSSSADIEGTPHSKPSDGENRAVEDTGQSDHSNGLFSKSKRSTSGDARSKQPVTPIDSENGSEDNSVDAAIVVSRLGAADVMEVLCDSDFELLPMKDTWQFALDEPLFRPIMMTEDHYPDCHLPKEGVATVAITAFLAARHDTPASLVQAVLKHLFAPDVASTLGIVSAERAAHWQGLVWHPAARKFFQSYHSADSKSQIRAQLLQPALP